MLQRAECKVRVSPADTIRVRKNTYSVHSRLIGYKVKVHLHAEKLEVHVGPRCVAQLPRLSATEGECIKGALPPPSSFIAGNLFHDSAGVHRPSRRPQSKEFMTTRNHIPVYPLRQTFFAGQGRAMPACDSHNRLRPPFGLTAGILEYAFRRNSTRQACILSARPLRGRSKTLYQTPCRLRAAFAQRQSFRNAPGGTVPTWDAGVRAIAETTAQYLPD